MEQQHNQTLTFSVNKGAIMIVFLQLLWSQQKNVTSIKKKSIWCVSDRNTMPFF